MTIRRALLSLGLIGFFAGVCLIIWWFLKPEQQIIRNRQSEIDRANGSSSPNTSSGGYRVQRITEGGILRAIRYYHEQELIALDYVDERGKVVRRDLLTDNKVRVQLFYDSAGRIGLTRYFDENGRVVRTTPDFLPVTPLRPGY